MNKIKYEVEHVDPHGEDPGKKMADRITEGGLQGKTLVTVIGLFNENLIVWQLPTHEQRG